MKTLKILTRLCKLIWFILTACGLLALNFFISPLVAALRYVLTGKKNDSPFDTWVEKQGQNHYNKYFKN